VRKSVPRCRRCVTRFFADFAGKKRFTFGEQPFTGFASEGMFLSMSVTDDSFTYVADLLDGRYDCVDRIVLNGYFLMGQTSGGFLTWWNQLCPGAPPGSKAAGADGGRLQSPASCLSQESEHPRHLLSAG